MRLFSPPWPGAAGIGDVSTQGCGFTASPAGALCNYFSLLRHLHYRLLYNSTLLRAVQFDHALACDIINIRKVVSHGRCSCIHHHYHHHYHPLVAIRTLWWFGHGRAQAVHVVASVTIVAEEQLVLKTEEMFRGLFTCGVT